MTIKKSQRRAYGRICGTGFLMMVAVANFTLDWSTNFPEALTEEEREYVSKLKTRINKDADLIRDFGHRMKKDA